MQKQQAVEWAKLAALQRELPDKLALAARAVAEAEQRLAHVLTLRAAGEPVKRSDLAVARMALNRSMRDAEDLHRIQAALPDLLERRQGRSVRLVPV